MTLPQTLHRASRALLLLAGVSFAYGAVTGIASHIAAQPSSPTAPHPPSRPPMLACVEGYDRLPGVSQVAFQVPPGDCWTHWQVRPGSTVGFWWDAQQPLFVQWAGEHGKLSKPFLDTPLNQTVISDFITAVRFKNSSAAPIPVTLRMN